MSKYLQIVAIIEKQPPQWKDFKNYLKEMTLEDLIVRLRIEEDNRVVEKKTFSNQAEAKANMAEDSKSKKNKKMMHFGLSKDKDKNAKRFKGNCYVCGKTSHRAKECCKKKGVGKNNDKPPQAN